MAPVTLWLAVVIGNLTLGIAVSDISLDQYLSRNQVPESYQEIFTTKNFEPQDASLRNAVFDIDLPPNQKPSIWTQHTDDDSKSKSIRSSPLSSENYKNYEKLLKFEKNAALSPSILLNNQQAENQRTLTSEIKNKTLKNNKFKSKTRKGYLDNEISLISALVQKINSNYTEIPNMEFLTDGAVPELQIGCEGLEKHIYRKKRSLKLFKNNKDPEISALHLQDLLKQWGIDISDDKITTRVQRGDIEVTEPSKLNTHNIPLRGDVPASIFHSTFFSNLDHQKYNLLPEKKVRKRDLWHLNKNNDDYSFNDEDRDEERNREMDERIRRELILLKRQIEADNIMERRKRNRHIHQKRHHSQEEYHNPEDQYRDFRNEKSELNTHYRPEYRQNDENRRSEGDRQVRPTNENPNQTYEERMRLWLQLKEEHERKIRERQLDRQRQQNIRDDSYGSTQQPQRELTTMNPYINVTPYYYSQYNRTKQPNASINPDNNQQDQQVIVTETTPQYIYQNKPHGSYEERLQEWKRMKEAHDKLVREREKVNRLAQGDPHNPTPDIQKTSEDLENERKLQEYIRRITPIVVTDRAYSRSPTSPANDRRRPEGNVNDDRRNEIELRRQEHHRRRLEDQRRIMEEERLRSTWQPRNESDNGREHEHQNEPTNNQPLNTNQNVPERNEDHRRQQQIHNETARHDHDEIGFHENRRTLGHDGNQDRQPRPFKISENDNRNENTRRVPGRYHQRNHSQTTQLTTTIQNQQYTDSPTEILTNSHFSNWDEEDEKRRLQVNQRRNRVRPDGTLRKQDTKYSQTYPQRTTARDPQDSEDQRSQFSNERNQEEYNNESYHEMKRNDETLDNTSHLRHESGSQTRVPVGSMLIVNPQYSGAFHSSLPSVSSRFGFEGSSEPNRDTNPMTSGLETQSLFSSLPRSNPLIKSPHSCVWAIVTCCRDPSKNERVTKCFEAVGCPEGNWDTKRCRKGNIRAANEEIRAFYQLTYNINN